jgi:alcohol dehydrogenase (NADP+)
MKYLSFANRDQMPVLGLGTWKSKPGEVYQAVKTALKIGYRHIDCAYIYQNEKEIGQAIKESIESGVVSREDLWITSKLWNDAHARHDVRDACEKTLHDLGLKYLDLYLIHWPVALPKGVLLPESGKDLLSLEERPISETWKSMEELVEAGLCKHIGVSNFSIKKLEDLIRFSNLKPEVNQIELHPYLQQPEMLDYCEEHNIFLTAYSPLGSADRPGAMKDEDEPILLNDPVVSAIAESHNASPAQVLIAWAIQRGTSVIPKSVNEDRLKENFTAEKIELSNESMEKLNDLDRQRRYITGSFWAGEGSPYSLSSLWDE